VGEQQLHRFKSEGGAARSHHFALDVDDFEAAYQKAKELELLDGETFGAAVRELPDGAVQMYIRDPAGNLVELNWPDVSTLDRSVIANIRRVVDERPQSDEALRSTLYHEVD